MLKSKVRILIYGLCVFALLGCEVKMPPGGNQNLQAADNASDKDSKTDATATIAPTTEDTLPKVLKNYQDNLISEYVPMLDSFAYATRYSIDLVIEDELTQFSGQENIVYTNLESEGLNEIYLMLLPNTAGNFLLVNDVQINGEPVSSENVFENTVLKVLFNEILEPGNSISIDLIFNGTIPQEMGGNYGLFTFQEEILAMDSFFPIIPVYDEQGWNVQDPPQNADLIFTDASFFNVTVEAPEDLTVISSGISAERKVADGHQIITFFGGPQRDFYIAASPRLIRNFKTEGETKIVSFYPKEFKDSGNLVLETASKAVKVFSELLGPYPYTELDLVSTPMLALGMEYSGAAAMGISLYQPGDYAGGISNASLLETSTVHEVAHQWFFNQVMNDQIDEPWLDEGLVQYLTYVYYREMYGSEAADQIKQSWEFRWSRANMQKIPIGKPARDYSSKDYSAIVYGRAPFFVLELEETMGEDVFSRFLADYVREYRWKTVNSQKFRAMAEETCSCDLTDLFEEWWAFE